MDQDLSQYGDIGMPSNPESRISPPTMQLCFSSSDDPPTEVMSWTADGRIFWKGREVTTDDELRQMVRDLHACMVGCIQAEAPEGDE